MKQRISIIIFPFLLSLLSFSCNNGNNLINILKDQEVSFEFGFTGCSFDIYKKDNDLFVRRTIFGSGVPVIGTISYIIDEKKPNHISFHKINALETDIKSIEIAENENFIIQSGKNNKIELTVNDKIYFETGRKEKKQ
jgi:hypothetical protein